MNLDLIIINPILFYLKDKNIDKWYVILTNNVLDVHLQKVKK